MKKGIYLFACLARHKNYNIIYQDICCKKYKCDIGGDALDVVLDNFDYIIATPPCNWWSKANPYFWKSAYALKTRHLLPLTLIKLSKTKKPFLVECVKNDKRYTENCIFKLCDQLNIKYCNIGRHTYFTDKIYYLDCPQHQDFKYGGVRVNNDGYNQGGSNVHNVIELFLNVVAND